MAFISSAIIAGQKTGITTVGVAVATGQRNGREVLIQSDTANTVTLLVGSSDSQVIELQPGQSMTLPVFNISMVFVKAVSGSSGIVNWLIRD